MGEGGRVLPTSRGLYNNTTGPITHLISEVHSIICYYISMPYDIIAIHAVHEHYIIHSL